MRALIERLRPAFPAGGVLVGLVGLVLMGDAVLQSAPVSQQLTARECDRLYEHQRHLLSLESSPFHPAAREAQSQLASESAGRAQRKYCQKHFDRPSMTCQLQAKDLSQLLRCGTIGTKTEPAKQPGEPGKTTRPTSDPQDAKTRQHVTQVDSGTCARSYEKMLSVHAASAEFQKRADAARLLEHWRSTAARESFARRCTRGFKVRDLNCILSSTDVTLLQACLLDAGA